MGQDDVFAAAREQMVRGLESRGTSASTLAALSSVRREVFLPWFFSHPPTMRHGGPDDVREWRADQPSPDADTVTLVYDAQRALGIARDEATGQTTSTVSAPVLLAAMLDMLELEPGMRVLEIGAGSGYTAALLAEVVGDPGLVTTIDIDARLVADARARLADAGYNGVEVLLGDGDRGLADRAPYDRIVATVGCQDLSPAWFEQLTPEGFALIPVQHGGVHPLMRAALEGEEIASRVVGRSGFVSMQGHQAFTRSPWPFAGRPGPRDDVQSEPLPPALARELTVEAGREHIGGLSAWAWNYYLALVDRRSAYLGMLAEADRSTAGIDSEAGTVVFSGPSGPSLATVLTDHLQAWLNLSRPDAGDFRSHWRRIDVDSTPSPGDRRWVIERVHHRQVVELPG